MIIQYIFWVSGSGKVKKEKLMRVDSGMNLTFDNAGHGHLDNHSENQHCMVLENNGLWDDDIYWRTKN